jgi:DNA primase
VPALESVVEQIKERLDITALIGAQVTLKKSGRSLKGLCPFHNEKTPSFYVFPDKGNYHCFGCGANGDVFTYVMRTQNLSFGDALSQLAEQAGVALPERRVETTEDRALERLREICASAAQFYHHQLRTEGGRVGREYLEKRGLAPGTSEVFQVGCAPEGWDHLLRYLAEKGYSPDEIAHAGLATAREGSSGHYDRFRNRVMFPICDTKGRVIGFGARALDDSLPKYLNSPQTSLFDKGGCLYGIDKAIPSIRELGSVVVVEGYFDALFLHQYGINNAVASLGTALTERQVSLLKRHTKKLFLALDADAAGAEATRRGLEVAIQVFDRKATPVPTGRGRVRYEETIDADLRILQLPAGKDPDEVVKEDPALWQQLVTQAQPVLDFYFALTSAKLDLTQPQNKSRAVEELLPVVRELAGDKVRQWHYVQRLANMVRVDERVLLTRLEQLGKGTAAGRAPQPAAAVPRQGLALAEYYLGLLLANLEQASVDCLLGPEDVAEPLVRQALAAIWEARQAGPLVLSRLLVEMEPVLQDYCAELQQRVAALPTLESADSLATLEIVVLRVQEQSCRRALTEYRHLVREAQEREDTREVADLLRHHGEVELRLDGIQKLLAQRQAARRY